MTSTPNAPAATTPHEPRKGSPQWWREQLLSPDRIDSLNRVATPHMTPERAVQCLTSVLMIRNPELLECLPASLSVALQTAVALGLEPGTYIHFIPFNDKDAGLICQTVVDYRGLIRIAMRSPLVAKIEARAVFPSDTFSFEAGDAERIVHVPDLESAKRSGPDLRFVYAIVTLSNGEKVRHVMTRADVENIRAMAKGSGSKFSPWSDPKHGYIEMARKTAARAVLKYVPVEESVARQINEADRTEFDFDERDRPALPMITTTGNAAARDLMAEINNRAAKTPEAQPVTAQPAAASGGTQQTAQPAAGSQAAQTARPAPVAQNWSGRPQPKPEAQPGQQTTFSRPAASPPPQTQRRELPDIDESEIPF